MVVPGEAAHPADREVGMAMEVASQVASEEQPEAEARLGAGEVAKEGLVVRVV